MLKQWFKFAIVPVFALATNVYADGTPIGYGVSNTVQTINRDLLENPTGSFSFEEIFSIDLGFSNYIVASITEDERFSYYDITNGSLNYGLFLNDVAVPLSNTTFYGPGTYELRVSGIVPNGFSGGQYFLNINVSTTPVPEPSSALFMMFGIGLLGLLSSRKLKS